MDIRRAQVTQAEHALGGAEGARLPQLKLSLSITRGDDALNAFGMKLSQERVTAADFEPARLNSPDPVNNVNTRVELLAPIYTGGHLAARIDMARSQLQAARQGDAAARQQLIRQVAEAYQGVHTARAYLGVADAAVKAAEENVRVSDKLLREGVAVKSDLLAARVGLEDARLRASEARRQEETALDRLKLLIGHPLAEPLEVGTAMRATLPGGDEAALIADARARHPALLARRGQVEAARAEVVAARAGRRPQLSLMARQDWNDNTLGLEAASYTIAGVLSWNAFDGGVVSAQVGRAEAARVEAEARLRQAEEGVAFELREALRQAREAEKRLAAREGAVVDAEEAQRLTRKRYENGVTTLVDLLGVEAQLDKARADRVAAAHALAVGRMEVKRAAGVLDLDNL